MIIKKINSDLVALVLSLVLTCPIWAAGTYSGGTGDEMHPYQISTVSDWQEFVNPANSGDWDKHFILMDNINFEGATLTPVAPDTHSNYGFQGVQFTGVFDGNEKVLRNATIDMAGAVGQDYVGVFGFIGNGAEIKDLGLENITVTGRNNVGGLCGGNHGFLNSCHVNGSVTGLSSTGGLCGYNGGTIDSCNTSGEVIGSYDPSLGTDSTGGLCGYNHGGIISQSYATGAVTGDYHVGGLVGYNHGSIIDSYATGAVTGVGGMGGLCGINEYGSISQSYATGAVTGDEWVGGLCGWLSVHGTISQSYATGEVSGIREGLGGLCGASYGTISQSYATGSVIGSEEQGNEAGGLCGANYGTINQSYATGDVAGSYLSGSLCGRNHGTITECYGTGLILLMLIPHLVTENYGPISDSFYECSDSMMASYCGFFPGGTSKTAAEMQDVRTFTDVFWSDGLDNPWDFDTVWIMPADDYPKLMWAFNGPQPALLASLTPDLAWQGKSISMTITGQNTSFFDEGSTITNVWLSKGDSTIDATGFAGTSPTTIEASFDISSSIQAGKWHLNVLGSVDGYLVLPNSFLVYMYPDLNGDQKVDLEDFALFAMHWMEGFSP